MYEQHYSSVSIYPILRITISSTAHGLFAVWTCWKTQILVSAVQPQNTETTLAMADI